MKVELTIFKSHKSRIMDSEEDRKIIDQLIKLYGEENVHVQTVRHI